MDYYEEFGLSPDASPEEIRQAHKRLAWLLHPDRLQDPELRRLAECQMKRLNAIYSVLADSERRREYDLSRQQEGAGISLPAPPVPAPPPRRRPNAVWALAAAACLVALYWTFSGYSARGPQAVSVARAGPVQLEPPRPTAESREVNAQSRRRQSGAGARAGSRAAVVSERQEQDTEELRRALRQAEAERDAILAQAARLRLSLKDIARAGEEAAPAGEGARPLPGASPARTLPPESPRLAGTWFYIPQTVDFASKDVYPPEYIDLTISEENGIVRGRYWARYRVPDRAISPEVFFRFQGEANESGVFSWTGRGGAHGEIRLRLISDETLEVVWLASELGQQMGLGSGTAVLIRQKRAERY